MSWFSWRRLHCLSYCRRRAPWADRTEWFTDTGYCLDRYYLENDET